MVFRKVQSFCRLDNRLKYLILEAYILLAWARYRKGKEFLKVAPSLGVRMKETGFQINSRDLEIAKLVSNSIHIASRYTFWESECLVKAMAGMKMLERREIESTLYLGMTKDAMGLSAHAWLRSGDFYVAGSEGMDKFTVIEKFAKFIKIKQVEGGSCG